MGYNAAMERDEIKQKLQELAGEGVGEAAILPESLLELIRQGDSSAEDSAKVTKRVYEAEKSLKNAVATAEKKQEEASEARTKAAAQTAENIATAQKSLGDALADMKKENDERFAALEKKALVNTVLAAAVLAVLLVAGGLVAWIIL